MKSLSIALSFCLATASLCMAQTLQDDFSNAANWSTVIYSNSFYDIEQVQVGSGNMTVLNQVGEPSVGCSNPDGCYVYGAHLYQGSTIDPAGTGLTSLTFSINYSCSSDSANGPCFGEGQAFGLILQQNGNIYFPVNPLDSGVTNGFSSVGLPVTYTPSSFALGIDLDQSQQPDFSSTGKPITVGFYTANSIPKGTTAYALQAQYSAFQVTATRPSSSCSQIVNGNSVRIFVTADSNRNSGTQMNASFIPNSGMSLAQAAEACGVTGFNWQQTVTSLPAPVDTKDDCSFTADGQYYLVCFYSNFSPSTPLMTPFIDPPPGGYPFSNSIDSYPFYCSGADIVDFTRPCYSGNPAQELNFSDAPTDPALNSLVLSLAPVQTRPTASSMGFTTELVGVIGNMPGPALYTWTWGSTNNREIVDGTLNGTGGIIGATKNLLAGQPGTGTGGITITGINGVPQTPVTAVQSPAPNNAGWNRSAVSVILSTANSGGSIEYSLTGAQVISLQTIAGNTAPVDISAQGTTTLTYNATEQAGITVASNILTIRIDETPPSITCGKPDGLWHASDVSISCTAGDALSGLANPSDASFTLSTSIPVGTETADASTGTHQVCDLAGNCATAGPISGIKVDKKPPSISIITPAAGAKYELNQVVDANYTCRDGGSGVAICRGNVSNGAAISTASTGSDTFTVNSTDNAGNVASPQSVSYLVTFGVCLLYNPDRVEGAGEVIRLRLQLCDAKRADVSSGNTVLHAISLVQTSTGASEPIHTPGDKDADDDFRFERRLGPTGGYVFDLKTRGLTPGSYQLTFTATADPLSHVLSFELRKRDDGHLELWGLVCEH